MTLRLNVEIPESESGFKMIKQNLWIIHTLAKPILQVKRDGSIRLPGKASRAAMLDPSDHASCCNI